MRGQSDGNGGQAVLGGGVFDTPLLSRTLPAVPRSEGGHARPLGRLLGRVGPRHRGWDDRLGDVAGSLVLTSVHAANWKKWEREKVVLNVIKFGSGAYV